VEEEEKERENEETTRKELKKKEKRRRWREMENENESSGCTSLKSEIRSITIVVGRRGGGIVPVNSARVIDDLIADSQMNFSLINWNRLGELFRSLLTAY